MAINLVPDICCSSRHNNSLVEKGDIISAARAIPLIIDEKTLVADVEVAEKAGGIFSLKPLSHPKSGLITLNRASRLSFQTFSQAR